MSTEQSQGNNPHYFFGLTLTTACICTLIDCWHIAISYTSIVLVDAYLIFVLYEGATRVDLDKSDAERPGCLKFPNLRFSLVQLGFLLVTVVTGFASMYIDSGEVTHGQLALTKQSDAIYFSFVTLTTLGYGEFVPQGPYARNLVVWQLATGSLLLLGVFPLVLSRVSGYKS